MIVLREVFQLHFGKAREALALVREALATGQRMGYPLSRVMGDVVGPYYTLVNESHFEAQPLAYGVRPKRLDYSEVRDIILYQV
ncbi:hypothetical protein [Calidithermus timidus]|jgi:hypothetical protein|uniref:hypothetical protein n=1 Tax=Calidithermus timidus TaxID=307124 RepID=UPI00039E0028|nr:hypothetical protein [Calidithermus timidus]